MELFKLFGTIAVNNSDANKSIDETIDKAKQGQSTFEKVATGFTKVGTTITNVGTKMMPVTLALGGMGMASVKTAADFESAMSQVASTMGMTAEEINNGSEEYAKLEKAARQMGSSTKFSAKESAEALNYLALAGYDVDKSIATLPTVLNLAAAGGMDLASASDMVTDAMSSLGDKAGKVETFVDKMAVTSQKSNTSVQQLGEAILTVGGTAKNMAGGVTEMNTCLGILADNGIKGAEGGTALRNMILSLSAPTDQAAKKMDELGLKVYDVNGNMRPMNDIFKDLDATLSTMSQGEQTDVLNTIFNKVDLKSANALLSNCGDRFDELSGYINNSKDAAQNMADTMQNNLNGQLTNLKSAIQEAGISLGQQMVPIIKSAVSVIQEWTNKFNSLDDSQKQMIVRIGAIVSAIAPALIIFGKVITGLGKMGLAFSNIGKIAKTTSVVFKGAFLSIETPIIAVVGAIGVLVGAFMTLWNSNENFRTKIIEIWNNIQSTVGGFIDGIKQRLSGIQEAFQNIIDFIVPVWQTFCEFLAPIFEGAFQSIADVLSGILDMILGLLDVFIGLFTGDWETALSGVEGLVSGFGDAIVGFFGGILTGIVNIFKMGWENIKTSTSTVLNAIKTIISNVMNAISSTISNIWNAIKSTVSNILNGISSTVSSVWNSISSTISSILSGISSKISSVWSSITSTITGAINNIKSGITSGLNAAKSTVTSIFDSIKSKIQSIMDGAANVVKNAIDKIKSFFNFSWSLPHLKMPHITITGSFSLMPPKAPHFSVDWYAKGGILDGATPFGFNGNSLMVGGEAGKEAIIPLEQNTKGLDLISDKIANRIGFNDTTEIQARMNKIIELMEKLLGMRITLDSGALVGQLAPAMDTALGSIYEAKERGGRSTW